jgi:hypothetical protein
MKNKIIQKLTIGIAAAVILVPAGVFASGGSGGSGGGGGTSTGGGGGGTATGGVGATGGGGGGTKVACVTTLSVTGTATEALSGNSFTAAYLLNSCQSKTKVSLTAVDIATGLTVYASPDLIGTTAVWTLPYTLTQYLVTARAYSGQTGVTLGTATTILSTTDRLPCTPSIVESVTTGYYGIYPAIWDGYNAQNCLTPNTSVRLRITNLATGQITYDVTTPVMSSMVDYEGAIVAYSNDYEFDADLLDASGAVLASDSHVVTSAPLR